MAKADKSTVLRRTQEILRLILAGGEFEDIRQYAAAQGWKLSERQLRRYQESAHQQLAEGVYRDHKQLLGRHLMQRRALYARALKTSDVRTALNVLRDEANLEGLYPSAKNGATLEERFGPAPPPLNREERFVRMLTAQTKSDKKELALIEHLTPYYQYKFQDTMIPFALLNVIALTYAAEQLDHASMFFMAVWHVEAGRDKDGTWDFVGGCHAYRFKIGVDAWDKFTDELGVDGGKLVQDNHLGTTLQLFTDRLYESAPDHDAFMAQLAKEGGDSARFPTAQAMAANWWGLLRQVLSE